LAVPGAISRTSAGRLEREVKEADMDDDGGHDEPQPRGALLLILIYLIVLLGFWLNTYLRIWRS
jgi:hypothetical protein